MDQQTMNIEGIDEQVREKKRMIEEARYQYSIGNCTKIGMMYVVTDLNSQITELYMMRIELILGALFD